MGISQLLIILFIIIEITSLTSSPTWVRDPMIDAGQAKVVNIETTPTSIVSSGTTQNLTQNYNKTDFSAAPRVILGMIGYGIFPTSNLSSTQIGFNLIITSTSKVRFSYTVNFKGVSCMALHFIYFAVLGYDSYYFLQNYYLTCIQIVMIDNSSSSLSNIAATNRWETTVLNNPAGMINNVSNNFSSLVLQAWPISYSLTPKNLIISYNVNASPFNSSSFVLNISTSESCSISAFGVSVLSVNSTFLLYRTYSQYIDISYLNTVGNSTPYSLVSSTLTDFNTQYIYRNSEMGIYGCYFPIGPTFTASFWYFNISTSNKSILSGVAIQQRMRSCGSTTPYYMYQQTLCYDSCPSYYYTNTTFNYCIACYYTCKQCIYSPDYKSCTSCDANTSRTLINSSCVCKPYYFDNNTLVCASCHQTCLSCFNQKNNGCVSCDSNSSRIFNNVTSTCDCISKYYQNQTCYPCINNCIACQYFALNFTLKCLQCNTTLNQAVNSIQTACQCANGFVLSNSSCVFGLANPICGNGVLQSGEQCDDDNTVNGDGCSASCKIQPNCKCTNNASIYPYSLCYFSSNVTFTVKSVYKYPLQNKIQLTINVLAANCNQDLLKLYLENSFSLQFAPLTRLLISTDITSQSTKYDPTTTNLVVQATYNQSIDLTTKLIKFTPSLSVNSNSSKYFFQSPITFTSLYKPSNLLLTTYLNEQQISIYKFLSFTFLALIVLGWIFILIAICYGQAAIAVETMLIIQLSYQSLLQSAFIYDGWTGLILYGKYTYGFNFNVNQATNNLDQLSIINLNTNLLNTLNVSPGILAFGVLLIVGIFIYQMIKFNTRRQQQDFTVSQAKINGILQSTTRHLSLQRENEQFYQLKKRITVFILQVVFVLMFLTFKIVIISLVNISANERANTLIISLPLLLCYGIIWYVYYRSYDLEFIHNLSFRKILTNKNKTSNHWSYKFGNIFIKYYYLFLFLLFGIFAIVDGALFIGAAFYIILISFAIVFLVLLLLFRIYFRKANIVRVVLNLVTIIVISILYLLQSLKINNQSQILAIPVIGLALLYITVTVNAAIFIRIQYKKSRKNKKKSSKKKIKNLHYQRKQTEQPQISFNQDVQIRQDINQRSDHLNYTRQGIRKQQEIIHYYEQYQQNEQAGQTKIKQNFFQKGNQLTKKKKIEKHSEQLNQIVKNIDQLQKENNNNQKFEQSHKEVAKDRDPQLDAQQNDYKYEQIFVDLHQNQIKDP